MALTDVKRAPTTEPLSDSRGLVTHPWNMFFRDIWGYLNSKLSGSGTAGTIPKWSDTYALTDSLITENSSLITVDGSVRLPEDGILYLGDNTTADKAYLYYSGQTLLIKNQNISSLTVDVNGNVTIPVAGIFSAETANTLLKLDSTKKVTSIADGTVGQYLKTDGAGAYTWQTIPPTVPGGSDTHVQFNDSGSFAGDADFTWGKTPNELSVNGHIYITPGNTLRLGTTVGNAYSQIFDTAGKLYIRTYEPGILINDLGNGGVSLFSGAGAQSQAFTVYGGATGAGKTLSLTVSQSLDGEALFTGCTNYSFSGNIVSSVSINDNASASPSTDGFFAFGVGGWDQANTEYVRISHNGSTAFINTWATGSGSIRPLTLGTNNTVAITISTGQTITLANLAGSGSGVVAVDNNGLLSWSAGVGSTVAGIICDEKVPSYTSGRLTQVLYKLATVTVATMAVTYDSHYNVATVAFSGSGVTAATWTFAYTLTAMWNGQY